MLLYWDMLEQISAYKTAKADTEKELIVEKISCFLPMQFEYLLQYSANKYNWWVQARILIALVYPCVKPVLSGLFRWMQDMN